MNMAKLVQCVAKRTGVTEATAESVIRATLGEIIKTVAYGEAVKLFGFGSFKPVKRLARMGRNPQTGATISIPQRVRAVFTPGASFKQYIEYVQRRRRHFGPYDESIETNG
jgi:DNA-binding protein HU-beta